MNKKIDNNMSDEIFFSFIKEKTEIPDEIKTIYQYTNIEALFNGIIVKEPKKKDDEICLWASHYMYLNDPTEIEIGQKCFEENLGHCIEGNNNNAKNDTINDSEYFITSFSTTIDSLPMWSMYGRNGSGIALGFDKDILRKEGNEVFLYKCVYLDKDVKDNIASFCENYKGEKLTKEDSKILGIFVIIVLLVALYLETKTEKPFKELLDDSDIMYLFLFMMFAKDPAYNYENEIRLLLQPDKDKIKYRCQNNLIIPYIENFFPKKALKEIWIGPTNDMERTEKSLRLYLDNKGFSDVKIYRSKVPYRK